MIVATLRIPLCLGGCGLQSPRIANDLLNHVDHFATARVLLVFIEACWCRACLRGIARELHLRRSRLVLQEAINLLHPLHSLSEDRLSEALVIDRFLVLSIF